MINEINITIEDVTYKSFTFSNYAALKKFLQNESKYWSDQRKKLEDEYKEVPVYERPGVHNIINFYSILDEDIQKLNNLDSDHLDQNTVSNALSITLNHAKSQWLWSGHPFANLYVECHRKYGHIGAENFLNVINKKSINTSSYNQFNSAMIAYEFIHQDSEIVKRRNTEKRSLSELRSLLNKTTSELIQEVDNFKNSFKQWDKNTKENWGSWFDDSNTKLNKLQEEKDQLFVDKISTYEKDINELEKTYEEKLRLAKPAEYWKKSAEKFEKHAHGWALCLISAIVLGLTLFSIFFITWFENKNLLLEINTVQGIVIFATILAAYAFLIKSLSRLTFSSFHLMRDSEEREQLTHLYLALINEKKIDETSRDIVLQSLFSRTETGLLTSESGPSMPTVIDLVRNANRN